MTNDKSNKELDKSTLRIPTFNMILRQILVFWLLVGRLLSPFG